MQTRAEPRSQRLAASRYSVSRRCQEKLILQRSAGLEYWRGNFGIFAGLLFRESKNAGILRLSRGHETKIVRHNSSNYGVALLNKPEKKPTWPRWPHRVSPNKQSAGARCRKARNRQEHFDRSGKNSATFSKTATGRQLIWRTY